MIWRAGVDALSLGLTKTGAVSAEIIILFGETAAKHDELEARRKRAGLMPPKARYSAAEALAMFDKDLWLTLAGRANASAKTLARALERAPDAELVHPVEGNLVFIRLPEAAIARLQTAGAGFYPLGGDRVCRFVCAWNTTEDEIEALAEAARG